MAKISTTLCLTTLLLALSHVIARTGPAFHDVTPMEPHHADNEVQKAAVDRDSCAGLSEDECGMKKIIEAQLEYIYAQRKKQP